MIYSNGNCLLNLQRTVIHLLTMLLVIVALMSLTFFGIRKLIIQESYLPVLTNSDHQIKTLELMSDPEREKRSQILNKFPIFLLQFRSLFLAPAGSPIVQFFGWLVC